MGTWICLDPHWQTANTPCSRWSCTRPGMTTAEFQKIVSDWLRTAKHPKTGRLYPEMVFQPWLELLDYLRGNGFKTFIVSAGELSSCKVFAKKV